MKMLSVRRMTSVLAVLLIAGLTGCNLFFPDTLPGVGTIEGYAFFSNSSTHDGIIITLERSDGLYTDSIVKSIERGAVSRNANFSTETDADGFYQFRGLSPGSYTVYATSKDSLERAAVLRNIQVEADQHTLADILNLTVVGNISGSIQVIDGSELDHAGFLVFIAGTSYMAMTDLDGSFTISGVPAGEGYVVIVSKKGYLAVWKNADVAAFETNEFDQKELTLQELNVPLASIIWKGTHAADPGNPEVNWAYYNSAEGKSYIYDGVLWQILAQDGAVVVSSIHINGDAVVGAVLNVSHINPPDADVTYQWKYSTNAVSFYSINGETADSYTVLSGDLGRYIRLDITGTGDFTGTATSNVTGPIGFAGGTGTEADPYQISDWHHLNNVPSVYSMHFGLIGDLDEETDGYAEHVGTRSEGWEPLPSWFRGTFDGNDHIISDLVISRTDNHVGLFRSISSGGIVRNLNLTDVQVSGNEYLGAVAGRNSGSIINCHVSGTVTGSGRSVGGLAGANSSVIKSCSNSAHITGTEYWVGGIAGLNEGGRIETSTNFGSVHAVYYAGGIAGSIRGGTILSSTNYGSISAETYRAGGIAGSNSSVIIGSGNEGTVTGGGQSVGGIAGFSNSVLRDCYNTGTVHGASLNVGGIVGHNFTHIDQDGEIAVMGKVYTSYNSGTVLSTNSRVGGIAGYNQGIVEDSYNTGSVSGDWFVGGIAGLFSQNGEVTRSYNTGTVSGASMAGKIAGTSSGTLTANYYLSDTADLGSGSENDQPGEFEAKTDAAMKLKATFINWDFIDVWNIDETISYPVLRSTLP